MSHRDEELGLPGNREILEHALRASTTQVLRLAPETNPSHRSLAERGADLVRGFDRVPADPPGGPVPAAIPRDATARDAVPRDSLALDPVALDSAPRDPGSLDAGPIDTGPHDAVDDLPPDLAEAYLRARSEVHAILAEHLGVVVQDGTVR
jgi:hypothetical protein